MYQEGQSLIMDFKHLHLLSKIQILHQILNGGKEPSINIQIIHQEYHSLIPKMMVYICLVSNVAIIMSLQELIVMMEMYYGNIHSQKQSQLLRKVRLYNLIKYHQLLRRQQLLIQEALLMIASYLESYMIQAAVATIDQLIYIRIQLPTDNE